MILSLFFDWINIYNEYLGQSCLVIFLPHPNSNSANPVSKPSILKLTCIYFKFTSEILVYRKPFVLKTYFHFPADPIFDT